LPSGALHQLLPYAHDPLAGRTKTMVRGHQTRESTEDPHESRTARSRLQITLSGR